MRRRLGLLCLPVLLLGLLEVSGTTPAGAAVIDADAAQCTITGALTTGVGPVPQTVSFTGSMILGCSGAGDEAGTWTMAMSGQLSPGVCAGGKGLASLTSGNGPEGSYGGTLQITAGAGSMDITATLGPGNDPGDHAFKASVAATPTSGTPCVDSTVKMQLSGTGTISDAPPPPQTVDCAVTGQDNYGAGFTLSTTSYQGTTDLNLQCAGNATHDVGTWRLSMATLGVGMCGQASGQWGGTTGSAPNLQIVNGGSGSFQRVGTLLEMQGDVMTSHDHGFALFAHLAPNGNCVTAPWASSSVAGDADLVN